MIYHQIIDERHGKFGRNNVNKGRGTMSDSKQITFSVNEKTLAVIEALKGPMNVDTTAAVLRRALALARVAVQNAHEDHTLIIIDKNNERRSIMLDG